MNISKLYWLLVIIVGSVIGIASIISVDPFFLSVLRGSWASVQNFELSTYTFNNEGVEGPFLVTKVIDGDTIELDNGWKVRYLYVDTPETVKRNSEVECFGPEASDFNKSYLEGKYVNLVSDKDKKDKYERDLRLVYLIGRDTGNYNESINAELVKLGFAKVTIYQPNDMYKEEFKMLEAGAKESKIGRWKSCEENKK